MQLHTPRLLRFSPIFGKIRDIATTGTSCLILNGINSADLVPVILTYSKYCFEIPDDGQVFVWGYGILGKGPKVDQSLEPTEIPPTLFGRNEFNTETKVTSIFGGLSQFAAITNTGDLYIWGRNRFGSLGLGHLENQFFPIKVIKY